MNTQTSYDQVAAEYAEKFKDEMDDKPFDRDCLDRLAREVGTLGPICDMGCGPGQIARYLHRQGVETLGVDLSPRMVAEAQRLNPEIHFHQGDMLALPDADNSWGGIAAFYCIIHIPREQDRGCITRIEARAQARRCAVDYISYRSGNQASRRMVGKARKSRFCFL